eukprot:snap_masked-scaffold_39-processed-gene-2.64-mRNA-1 protein AED:1.00 eAED:1.00 QI:0/-1/0/0/-1/1/1/0/290
MQNVPSKQETHPSCLSIISSYFTKRNILLLFLYVILIGAVALLVTLGFIAELTDFAEEELILGYTVFFLLLILVSQPYGWGYSIVEIALGFIYAWRGLIILQIGAQIGSTLAFFSVRKFRSKCSCVENKVLNPEKEKILQENLNRLTSGKKRETYPVMIFSRQSPLPFGIVTTLLALTDVSFLDFYVTLVLGVFLEGPLNINLGILLRELEDARDDGENSTDEVDEEVKKLEDEEERTRLIQTYLSLVITLGFLFLFSLYGRIIWKKLNKKPPEEREESSISIKDPENML